MTFRAISIDPSGTCVFDDAFWVARTDAGWRVQVAFPRVGDAVPYGGSLDTYLRAGHNEPHRGKRLYDVVSERDARRLSLDGEGEKDVFVVTVDVARDFTYGLPSVGFDTFESVGTLSYEDVEATILDPGRPFHDDLALLVELSAGFLTRRGTAKVRGDRTGRAINGLAETMILVNASLARACAVHGYPLVYRNYVAHPRRSGTPVDARLGPGEVALGGPSFEVECRGHWPLGVSAYACFTSPLRRYVDLVNQRMLEDALLGRAPRHDQASLADIARDFDTKAFSNRPTPDFSRPLNVRSVYEPGSLGAPMPDKYREVEDRIDDLFDASPGRIFEAMLHDPDLARRAVDACVDDSVLLTGLRMHGIHGREWTAEIEYEEGRSGDVSRHGAVVVLTAEGATHRTELTWANSRKAARHAANVAAVALAFGLRPPLPQSLDHVDDDDSRDVLHVSCMAMGWPSPVVETVSASNPDRFRTYRSVASVVTPDGMLSSPETRGFLKSDVERRALDGLFDVVQAALSARVATMSEVSEEADALVP